jgi:hypothetical protein
MGAVDVWNFMDEMDIMQKVSPMMLEVLGSL